MNSYWILAVPLLVGLNAFFVAAEYTVVASRARHIDALRRAGHRVVADAMVQLKSHTAATIGTIQVCITMTNLLLGWIGEPVMSNLLRRLLGPLAEQIPLSVSTPLSIAMAFVLVTLLTVVFSELLPKAMTLRYMEAAAVLTARPVLTVSQVVWPLVWLMNKLANMVTRPLGLGRVDQAEDDRVTTAEIRLLTTTAAEEGELTPRERSVILNALTLADRTANQVMVPRVRITYLDMKHTMEENRRAINQRLYSRLPLCNGSIDHVIGVVHIKEFLSAYNAAGDVSVLGLIAREPVFVPETTTLDKLLSLFAEKRTQMVIVLDEYGGVSGLVTLRDVVDRLLGEGEQPAVAAASQPAASVTTLTMPGDTPVYDVAQRIGRHEWCAHENAATLAGLIQDRLGRFPETGEEVLVEQVRLCVLDADGHRIQRVEVITGPTENSHT